MTTEELTDRVNKLKCLDAYEALNKPETSSQFWALRCFFMTGSVRLITAFYKRGIAVIFRKSKIA
jgi:hypothetical protein